MGASELARASDEPPEVLRQRVTSKGGTTYAAIMSMEQDNVKNLFMRALHAAQRRAHELGDEFGGLKTPPGRCRSSQADTTKRHRQTR